MPLQVGYRQHGESGIEITDWWPHLATCVDDLALSARCTRPTTITPPRTRFTRADTSSTNKQPSIGAGRAMAWGRLNENCRSSSCSAGRRGPTHASRSTPHYLGPTYSGVPLAIGKGDPLPFGRRSASVLADEQKNEFDLINRLNGLANVEYPDDPTVAARIRSYELAYRMQMAVPECST